MTLGIWQLPNQCAPPEAEGRTYILVATTGSLTGTFAGIPDGGTFFPRTEGLLRYVPEPGYRAYCPQYPVRIDYTPNAVEATVLEPVIRQVPGPPLTPVTPAGPAPTGQRAAAFKKCKKFDKKKARRKCNKKARRLPV